MIKTLAKNISARQRVFCDLLATGKYSNGQAYIAAGYNSDNVESASACANELLKNIKVRAYYDALVDKAANKSAVTVERVQEKLSEIAFSGLEEVLRQDDKGNVKIKSKANFEGLDAISVSEGTTEHGYSKSFSIKRADRLKALDMLCKINRYYEPKQSDTNRNWGDRAQFILDALSKLKK